MKSVVIHRIAVAMSLLLLIAGVVAYLYLRHSQISQPLTTSLYSLVPADAVAVVETDDVVSFVGEVTDGSLADAPLPMSDIVKCLKEYVDEFLESSPHGITSPKTPLVRFCIAVLKPMMLHYCRNISPVISRTLRVNAK